MPKIHFTVFMTDSASFDQWAGIPVLTLQKEQVRVQVSPNIMCRFLSQQSDTFGQAVSWQTVTRLF